MCGRFTLTLSAEEVKEAFNLDEIPPGWIPSYNIAPSQMVLAATLDTSLKMKFMQWGLSSPFGEGHNPGIIINIRKETLVEKKTFGKIFKNQRCIIPVDGFFEWKKARKGTKGSIPYYFRFKGKGLAFAGLWDVSHGAAQESMQCALVTAPANDRVAQVHERMPVILTRAAQQTWLSQADPLLLGSVLQSYPSEQMEHYPVSTRVNSPGNNSIQCIQPGLIEQSQFKF